MAFPYLDLPPFISPSQKMVPPQKCLFLHHFWVPACHLASWPQLRPVFCDCHSSSTFSLLLLSYPMPESFIYHFQHSQRILHHLWLHIPSLPVEELSRGGPDQNQGPNTQGQGEVAGGICWLATHHIGHQSHGSSHCQLHRKCCPLTFYLTCKIYCSEATSIQGLQKCS